MNSELSKNNEYATGQVNIQDRGAKSANTLEQSIDEQKKTERNIELKLICVFLS